MDRRPFFTNTNTPPPAPSTPETSAAAADTPNVSITANPTGGGGVLEHNKKLKSFFSADKPPRKRLRAVLEFFNGGGNKELITLFWEEQYIALYSLILTSLAELEALYHPYPNAFGKVRQRLFSPEDWSDFFEVLHSLIKWKRDKICRGWQNNGFNIMFSKLLHRDNNGYLRKHGFETLVRYVDAVRKRGFEGAHITLLRQSIDFTPFANPNMSLPEIVSSGATVDGWRRGGNMAVQAEEPVDMLKYVLDLSLEKDDDSAEQNDKSHSSITANETVQKTRFMFWCDVVMQFYIPLLYPKICIRVGLKEANNKLGFFHHCPGSFQRVIARWIYKLKYKENHFDAIWSQGKYVDIFMETLRQRFIYRDVELVMDAIKFYFGISSGMLYIPSKMKDQMPGMLRAMISHISQLFHPGAQFEADKNVEMLLAGAELLETICTEMAPLDEYTKQYFRKSMIQLIETTSTNSKHCMKDVVLKKIISVLFHVWICTETKIEVWSELKVALARWMLSSTTSNTSSSSEGSNVLMGHLITQWKNEILSMSETFFMHLIDLPPAVNIKSATGRKTISVATQEENGTKEEVNLVAKCKQIKSADDALILLDRILHLIPPSTMSGNSLASFHLTMQESLLEIVLFWTQTISLPETLYRKQQLQLQKACGSVSGANDPLPAEYHLLRRIRGSTLLSLFGEWLFPACSSSSSVVLGLDMSKAEYERSRCVALTCLCQLSCQSDLSLADRSRLVGVFHVGLLSNRRTIVSTIIQHLQCATTQMTILIPACVRAIDQITKGMEMGNDFVFSHAPARANRELASILKMIGSISCLAARIAPDGNFSHWKSQLWEKIQVLSEAQPQMYELTKLIEEIPNIDQLRISLGEIVLRVLGLKLEKDELNIKPQCLWLLYFLIVLELTCPVDDKDDSTLKKSVSSWVITLCEYCSSATNCVSSKICLTALQVLSCLAAFSQKMTTLNSALVPHILMALSILIQQQIEEAALLVSSSMASNPVTPTATMTKSTAKAAQEKNSKYSAALNSTNKVTGSMAFQSSTPRLKNDSVMLRSFDGDGPMTPVSNTNSTAPTSPSANNTESLASPTSKDIGKKESEQALETVAAKTSLLFEVLGRYLMDPANRHFIVEDAAISQIVFTAIEAALVGILPSDHKNKSGWETRVHEERQRKRRTSTPLLFLGLSMREQLEKTKQTSSLQYFEETAVAAEGLLLHMLHHFHNFPCADVSSDQFLSKCTEFDQQGNVATKDVTLLSFVYMKTMIISLIGSEANQFARIVVRDMTGTYTLDTTPINPSPNSSSNSIMDNLRSNVYDGNHSLSERKERLFVTTENSKVKTNCETCNQTLTKKKIEKIVVVSEAYDAPANLYYARQPYKHKQYTNYQFHNEKNLLAEERYRPTSFCSCQGDKKNFATPILGLLHIEEGKKLRIGSLEGEKSMLDLILDALPLKFKDCGGELAEKTLLGGKYTLQQETLASFTEGKPPKKAGFLLKFVHDEECYVKLKNFLLQENQKPLVQFIDAIKRFERLSASEDEERSALGCLIYWDFISHEAARSLIDFPTALLANLESNLSQSNLPCDLFHDIFYHLEENLFNNSEGFFPRFLNSLDSISSRKSNSSKNSNVNIPTQLKCYDQLYLMENNVMLYQLLMEEQRKLKWKAVANDDVVVNERKTRMDMCRLVLSQLDFFLEPPDSLNDVNYNLKKEHAMQFLTNGAKLERSLKHLDQTPARENMKIGVIFVDCDQYHQREILANDSYSCSNSDDYQSFLNGLGWEVDLKNHKGYLGGLDKNCSNGTHTIYYATSTLEIIYHVVTKMPTKPNCQQQIDKKRHVGNDFVHIVWSENSAAYSPKTITSNFNDAQIVIYPLTGLYKGLYRIQIFSKPTVPWFGPLMSGMVVDKSNLPLLVRQTAIQANRMCRTKTSIYRRPYPTRLDLIKEVRERYATKYQEEELFSRLFS